MNKLLISLFLASCSQTPKQVNMTVARCAPIIVFTSSYPLCTFSPIGELVAEGYSKPEVMASIQYQVCKVGGHALVETTTEWKEGKMIRKGTIVRCNVPFLLKSDLLPRG